MTIEATCEVRMLLQPMHSACIRLGCGTMSKAGGTPSHLFDHYRAMTTGR